MNASAPVLPYLERPRLSFRQWLWRIAQWALLAFGWLVVVGVIFWALAWSRA